MPSVPPPAAPGVGIGIALGATSANTAANAGEVFSDSEDEMDEEQKAKHQEFKGKRQAHYSNEAALALKRAREKATSPSTVSQGLSAA